MQAVRSSETSMNILPDCTASHPRRRYISYAEQIARKIKGRKYEKHENKWGKETDRNTERESKRIRKTQRGNKK
jgi:hypothetical protein